MKVAVTLADGTVIAGVFEPNAAEKQACWEVCFELVNRVPIIPLRDNEGLLREALTSLRDVFAAVRESAKSGGPSVALHRRGQLSFAFLASILLNQALRPVTSYWHPELLKYEAAKPADQNAVDHERSWDRYAELSEDLASLRSVLVDFARAFAEACGAEEFLRQVLDEEGRLFEPSSRPALRRRALSPEPRSAASRRT